MHESANLCENRLLFYRGAVNAPLGMSVGFSPMFPARSVKTEAKLPVLPQQEVKTDAD